jgi:hypothetical protein
LIYGSVKYANIVKYLTDCLAVHIMSARAASLKI